MTIPDLDGDGTALVSRTSAASTVVVRGYSIAASFLLTVAVTRILGAQAGGEFFIVFTVVTLLATFGRWGTDTLTLKITASGEPGSGQVAAQLIKLGVAISAGLALVLTFALPAALEAATKAEAPVLAVRFAALSIISSTAYLGAASALRGRGRVALGTFAELGSTPTLAVLGLVVLWAFGEPDLVWAFGIYLAASVATALWSFPFAWRALGAQPTASRGLGFLRVAQGRAGQLSSMCGSAVLLFALTWVPVLTLSVVSVPAEVAYYTAAARLAAFVSLIPAIQSSYLAPQFANLFHAGRLGVLNALCRRSSWQATLLALVPTAALVLLPGVTHLFFGSEFEAGAGLVRILATGALLIVTLGQVPILMVNCGLERYAAAIGLLSLVAGTAAMAWLGHADGATGVAIGASATLLSYAALGSLALRRRAAISSGIYALPTTTTTRLGG